MDDLGARLKHAREDKGISLKDIATRTKISAVALEALERNDFTRLPGGIFGRAFVRAYALEIDLDPEATVADFLVHLERSEREAAERGAIRAEITSDDREFIERQRRAIRVVRVVLAVAAVVGVVALAWALRGMWPKDEDAEDAAASAAPVTTPAAPVQTSAPPPAPVVSPPAVQPVAETPAADGSIVVDLRADADCWVFVAADGARAVSRLLRSGDHERVEAKRELLLDVGDAGALQWTINGKPAKPLGKSGAHVRTTVSAANIQVFLQ